jgi:hypothetical protein
MAAAKIMAMEAPPLPPRARFPIMRIPDPNFPKIKSTLELQRDHLYCLDHAERERLAESPVGTELSRTLDRCKAYRSKMETAQNAWEHAQQATYESSEEAKKAVNQKKGLFAVNHREYKTCLIVMRCPEKMERFQRCWDVEGHDVVKEITETGQFRHASVCRAEKLAIERCMGNLVSRSIRSATGTTGRDAMSS